MIVAVVLFLFFSVCLAHEHKVVKNSKGEFFYLSFNHAEYLRPIADNTSVEILGFNLQSVITVNDSYLGNFKRLPALQSLHMTDTSADETMRVKITKILILAHPSYIIESFPFKKKLNPSIELIGGSILMAWRDHIFDSPIKFAWLEKTNLTYLPSTFSHFGIDNFITPEITSYDWNPIQEDPRLMLLPSSKELYVQYHAKEDVMKAVRTALCIVTPEAQAGEKKALEGSSPGLVTQHDTENGQYKTGTSSTNTANYSNNRVFDLYEESQLSNPKNWVMFFDHTTTKKVLFMENINPMVILEPASHEEETSRHSGVRVVLHSSEEVRLPWLDEYGMLIRGGTPAILVPSHNVTGGFVNLAFFHTKAGFQVPHLWTYFMGAFTFCPTYPYNIQSMSSRPIVPWSGLYEGEWVKGPVLDYVVFPTGIVLLEDRETLLVSFGSQDKDGYVMKMSLKGLLASMTEVRDCGQVKQKRHVRKR